MIPDPLDRRRPVIIRLLAALALDAGRGITAAVTRLVRET